VDINYYKPDMDLKMEGYSTHRTKYPVIEIEGKKFKKCAMCGEIKDLNLYPYEGRYKMRRRSKCDVCDPIYTKQLHERSVAKKRAEEISKKATR
jgi:hypothetical protein